MISQSTFEQTQTECDYFQRTVGRLPVDVELFLNPRWLVIHGETKQGFYVDRCHEPTISVSMCTEPEFFVEKFDYCIFVPRPKWALSEPASAFVTFVLETT